MKQTLIALLLSLTTAYGYCQNTDSLQNTKIKYTPTRFTVGGQDGYKITWVGIEKEFKIVKNTLNLGVLGDYGFPKGGEYSLYIGGVYLAPYIAVNRQIFSNYEKQNQGFFLFAKLGYAGYAVNVPDVSHSITFGPIYGIGGDFFITPGFGLTATGFFFTKNNEPAIIQGGIVAIF